jgi:hypothetical protein
LTVQDSVLRPTSEREISSVLEKIQIENLDWRKLDIDLDVLRNLEQLTQLRELHLYSSSNWGILYFWGMDDLLHVMENVRVRF